MKATLLCSIIFSSMVLTGCMTTATLSSEQRPAYWGKSINPQYNFYKISKTLYRSEQPSAELIPELKHDHIDVVINLRSRHSDKIILQNQNLQLVDIPIKTWAINRHDLLDVMQTIRMAQQNDQRVLVHCYHGSDRTGASIAMYRIIFENWQVDDALNEMKHGGYGFHAIWVNIEKLFTPENIKWIREQLSNPS